MCTKNYFHKFLRSLITNMKSDFTNSKWRIQYGGHKIFNLVKCVLKILFIGFWGPCLRIWGQILQIQNGRSYIADEKFWICSNVYGFYIYWILTKNISYFKWYVPNILWNTLLFWYTGLGPAVAEFRSFFPFFLVFCFFFWFFFCFFSTNLFMCNYIFQNCDLIVVLKCY